MRFSLRNARIIICSLLGFVLLGGSTITAHATTTESQYRDSVFITAFSPGEVGCASCEFIELGNMSDKPIDVTGWRVEYQAAAENSRVFGLKTLKSDNGVFFVLPPGAKESLFDSAHSLPGMITFSARMAESGGTIYVRDSGGALVDAVAWGNSTHGLGQPVTKSSSGWYVRVQFSGDNQRDYAEAEKGSYSLVYGSLLEIVDACSNIDGLQYEPPNNMIRQADGTCRELDVCPNLEGIQDAVPPGYYKQDGACLVRELPKIRINEVLANPVGVDTGVEYVELFNPTDTVASLQDYAIEVNGKALFLPSSELASNMFFVTRSVTLPNGGATVVLRDAVTGSVIDSVSYPAAKDDVAWAYDEKVREWKATTLSTPGALNVFPIVEKSDDTNHQHTRTPCRADQYRNPVTGRCKQYATASKPTACPAGKVRNPTTNRCRNIAQSTLVRQPCRPDQYRSPETNRCRKLFSSTSTRTPCRPDQYRNPATNRCRKFATAASATSRKPCRPDQYRHPETNRCRKIASKAGLKPCRSGQERNPETNRCRKVRGAALTGADGSFPVTDVATTTHTKMGWWLVGGSSALGGAAIGWNRRDQFLRLFRRLFSRSNQ